MRHLAYFDSVTGLPNRALLRKIFYQTLANATRYRRSFALLFVDLDHFKRINDTFGHETGDGVLRAVSRRLRTCLRSGDRVARASEEDDVAETLALGGDTVTRLGGDEFVVLLNEISSPDHASVVARRMIEALARPVDVGRAHVTVTGSIGIAISPLDGSDFESVLKHADAAMYHAKKSGRNQVQYFSDSLNEHAQRRFRLEHDLFLALERQEFVLFYQPMIDLRNNRVSGLEALLRWRHPRDGLLGPDTFLPIAEDIGLMAAIDDWVLETVCVQTAAWRGGGFDGLRVSMNVSPAQFRYGRLIDRFSAIVCRADIAPGALEIEVSEGVLFDDSDAARPILEKLAGLGVGTAVDNFGCGFSSLESLRTLTVGALKIDRGFVADIADGAGLVVALVALARALRQRVVAEGVETREQLAALRHCGCDEAQGRLFAPPLPAGEIETWMLRHNAAAEWRSEAAVQPITALGR
jgi:predicted signal transduction protein with EAL and GGDEF domain